MMGGVGVQGADHADIVDAPAEVRKNLADLDAAPSEFLELEGRLQQVAGLTLGLEIGRGHGLAVVLGEHGLGIEWVHLAGAAVKVQEYDALGVGSEERGGYVEPAARLLTRAQHAPDAGS